jgi:hypothetical protein
MAQFEKEFRPGMLAGQHIISVDSSGWYVPASLKLAGYVRAQGAYEGMDAHRFAAVIRLSNLKE